MSTTLIRWHPFTDFAELRHRLDRVFEEVEDGERRAWVPAIDLVEEEDRLVLRADLPGMTTEEIDISVEDDVLTVSGQHEAETEEKDEQYVRRERRRGAFSRSLALPEGVKADDIEATCSEGVLEVVIPRPKLERKQAVQIKPKPKAKAA